MKLISLLTTIVCIFLHNECAAKSLVHLKIAAINDFHGQLTEGQMVSKRPVGGIAALSSYLKAVKDGPQDYTIFVETGDLVGGSEATSALLQDEPTIEFFNSLCNRCDKLNPHNNCVGALGNHEFDEGVAELSRLLHGGNHPKGPFLKDPYKGTRFPVVCSNVIDSITSYPLVAPFSIKRIPNTQISVAFIGAILKATPSVVLPTHVKGLQFLDEASTINYYVHMLRQTMGIHTFIILLHQGGKQTAYQGSTDSSSQLTGDIVQIIRELDDDIDVVCSGHSHNFTNAFVPNRNGKKILVTQAYKKGTAYADIDIFINRKTGDVDSNSAQIITTWNDEGPGLLPDPAAEKLKKACKKIVEPLTSKIIGRASKKIQNSSNNSGESALGNLIADAQRMAGHSDFACMNPGGIRAAIDTGTVTWGDLYDVQPFSNQLITMTMTGQQIIDVLNQQWEADTSGKILHVSGLTYTWSSQRPRGDRIVQVLQNDAELDRSKLYTVTVNSFLADGGDLFTQFLHGTNKTTGMIDIDALVAFIENLPQPFTAKIEGRIKKIN